MSDTKHSSQSTDNRSFNDTYEIYENLNYGYSSDDSAIHALAVDANGLLKTTTSVEPPTFSDAQQVTLAVTATTGSVSFAQPVKSVLIENTGSNDAYINFGGAALTTHYRLAPYESLSLELTFTALHAICDATKTTTLRAIGLF